MNQEFAEMVMKQLLDWQRKLEKRKDNIEECKLDDEEKEKT